MQDPIEFSGQITRNDYIRFVNLGLWKRSKIPFVVYLLLLMYITFYLVMEVYATPAHDWLAVIAGQDWMTLGLYVFPAAFYLLVLFVSMASFAGDKLLQKKRSYKLDDSGFTCIDDHSRNYLPWTDIREYAESKHTFIIYVTARKAYPLPKHFMTAEQEKQVRDLLKARITLGRSVKLSGLKKLAYYLSVIALTWLIVSRSDGKEEKARALAEAGYRKMLSKEYKAALLLYDQAIRENPQLAVAYVHRGYIKGMLQNKVGGLEDCSRAVLLDSTNANAYLQLGYARFALHDTLGACEAFHQAERKGDKDAGAMIVRYCR